MDNVFYTRGQEAFDEGLPCAPMLDPELTPMLKDFDGPVSEALVMWHEGWTVKNLFTPWKEKKLKIVR